MGSFAVRRFEVFICPHPQRKADRFQEIARAQKAAYAFKDVALRIRNTRRAAFCDTARVGDFNYFCHFYQRIHKKRNTGKIVAYRSAG